MERISFKQIKVFLDFSFMIQLFCCSARSWSHGKGQHGWWVDEKTLKLITLVWRRYKINAYSRGITLVYHVTVYHETIPVLSVPLGFLFWLTQKHSWPQSFYFMCKQEALVNVHLSSITTTQKCSNKLCEEAGFHSITYWGKTSRSESLLSTSAVN